ncbi:dsDNA nuclease domain-containing protein [Janthinobacterium sp. SUN026]|uniref:dsDNA nuclease domain-containing protein n=1 Tax=Janthinobacterium sp. SUN026 TaxID=3002438 RepID=UPI0025B158DD|nr:dsDNA nuclease domain-containing protein [Janthinobacterium sp. SUN026]MDN2673716.1 dsDNA nuclease domain-containing protein [Janthinobacterium sp. SUN026]
MKANNAMNRDDSGGVGAKSGFLFQDYVAAYYVFQMLQNKKIAAVRCEVTDDIDVLYINNEIEYVQVKTTEGDRKWSITELCAVEKVKKERGKPKPPPPNDSILHKSLNCDVDIFVKTIFKIVSKRDVLNALNYLRTPIAARVDTSPKVELLKSLNTKIGSFLSPAGRDVEFWLDNASWDVFSSIDEIELKIYRDIMVSAHDHGILLDPSRDAKIILNDVLCTLTRKSALSRKITCADDKTYLRSDFLSWFFEEIKILAAKNSRLNTKVYVEFSKTQPVLLKFSDYGSDRQVGIGLEQGYEFGKYRFNYIADSIINWMPEILLRPSELADISRENFFAKSAKISKRFLEQSSDFSEFLGRILMHSSVRYYSNSEPIPVALYIDKNGKDFKEFENVHIVRADSGDELWMGFSSLSEKLSLAESMERVCAQLYELITVDFRLQRKKILEVKENNYLLKHDIDELLVESSPLDDHIHRFKFVMFIGYKSAHLSIEEEGHDYKTEQLIEAQENFEKIIEKILSKDKYFSRINVLLYLYPNPCIKTLADVVRKKINEVIDA